MTYGDGVSDVDIRRLLDVPPDQRPAGDGHRRAPAGPLRRARARRRQGGRVSARSRPATAAGSMAASSCCRPRSSTTSTATPRCGSRSRSSAWRATASSAPIATTGFWQPMDTLRDKRHLEELWQTGQRAVEDVVSRRSRVLARPARPRHRPHRLQGRLAQPLARARSAPASPALRCRPTTSPSLFTLAGLERARSIRSLGDIRDPAPSSTPSWRSRAPRSSSTSPRRRSCGARTPIRSAPTRPTSWARCTSSRPRAAPTGLRAVVVVTSDKCYENREWWWPYREDDAAGRPRSLQQQQGLRRARDGGLAAIASSAAPASPAGVASARAGNVIGGGDWAEDRLVPDCMRGLRRRASRCVIRRPAAVRPWQHVLEPLVGLPRCSPSAWPSEPGRFRRSLELRSVGRRGAAGRLGRRSARPVLGRRRALGARCRRRSRTKRACLQVDASKARARLGWTPRLSPRRGPALDRRLVPARRQPARTRPH